MISNNPKSENASSDRGVYLTNGALADIGVPEDFTFTLEDGPVLTKSIRVISTTRHEA